LWGPAFWHLPELQGLQTLFTAAGCGVQFLGQRSWDLGRRMEGLLRSPPYTLEAMVKLLDILRRLLELPRRLLNPSAASEAPGMDARLAEVLTLIRQRAHGPLTQTECARAMRMSPPAFSRWFKAQTGRTFQCHLNELRVANVCSHLAGGKENATQAAFACGYGNLANFYRRFRQFTGLSPSQFRSLMRQGRDQRVRELIIRHGLHSAVRISPLGVA
jgi:AraC-like DNA-binding protein